MHNITVVVGFAYGVLGWVVACVHGAAVLGFLGELVVVVNESFFVMSFDWITRLICTSTPLMC